MLLYFYITILLNYSWWVLVPLLQILVQHRPATNWSLISKILSKDLLLLRKIRLWLRRNSINNLTVNQNLTLIRTIVLIMTILWINLTFSILNCMLRSMKIYRNWGKDRMVLFINAWRKRVERCMHVKLLCLMTNMCLNWGRISFWWRDYLIET